MRYSPSLTPSLHSSSDVSLPASPSSLVPSPTPSTSPLTFTPSPSSSTPPLLSLDLVLRSYGLPRALSSAPALTPTRRRRGLPPHSTMGSFNGIFFSIFQVNQFLGNLLAALLYSYQASQANVFSVMTVICGCGVTTLLLLPKPATAGTSRTVLREEKDSPGEGEEEEVVEEEVVPSNEWSLSSVLSSLALLREVRLLLLLPIITYSGFSQSWIYGAFPPLIAGNNHRFFVLAFFGAMDAASSYTMGKLSDRTGRMPILVLGFIAHCIIFGAIVLGWTPAVVTGPNPDNPTGPAIAYMPLDLVYFFLGAFLLGLGDGVFNTQVYAILGTFYKKKAAAAFANYKLFQSMSTAIFFFYLYFTEVQAIRNRSIIPLACMGIGMVLIVYCNVLFPFEANKQQKGLGGGIVSDDGLEEGSNGAVEDEAEVEEEDENGEVVTPANNRGKAARRQH